jgi:predicted secreted protein
VTENQRDYVAAKFPRSRSWKIRVQRMSDAQVYAIYMRVKAEEAEKEKKDPDDGQDEIPF